MTAACYILHVIWGVEHPPHLPKNIGPFASRDEAFAWAGVNVRNGSYEAWPIYPPMRIGGGDE